jgi:ABC-2 type transport system permease protein
LQSRRFRDLSIILIGVVSSSYYLIQQFVLRGLGVEHIYENMQAGTISPYLQWSPPGMAARTIQHASQGDWGSSFAWLGGLLVTTVIVLYLWQLVVERGLTASESGGSSRVRRRSTEPTAKIAIPVPSSTSNSTGLVARIVSSQFFSIAVKDIKYYRRDPQMLRLLISFVLVIVLVAVGLLNTGSSRAQAFGPWAVMIAPVYALFLLTTLSYNILGMERQSLTSLFLFPVNPKQILWGKNIVTFVLGLIEVLLLVLVVAFVENSWNLVLPAITIGLTGIGIILGCGNFSSIFFPQRMPLARRGFQSSNSVTSEGGCLRSVMAFVVLLVMIIMLIPVVAGLVLPVIYHAQLIWWVTIPASLLYSAAFYIIVTNLTAPHMLERTPEILAVVTRE